MAVYLLVLVIILFALFWRLYIYRKTTLENFAESKILKDILIPRSQTNYWTKVIAVCAAWTLATLALMQPTGNGHYPLKEMAAGETKTKGSENEAIVRRKAHDVIFLVDASASMEVGDTRTKESRLDFAKEIIDEIISRLTGESVVLDAFTSDTTQLSPLTMDYLFVRLMLRQLQINEGEIAGTNLVEAIADMKDFYFPTITPKLKTLILLTDGGDTQLEELTAPERENQINTILNLANDAKENQLRIFTIGMGTQKGSEVPGVLYEGKPVVSSLDDDLLKKLSAKGRGEYYFANDWTAMELAVNIISKMGEEGSPLEEYKVQLPSGISRGDEDLLFDLFFQYPLALALIFLSVALIFPDSRIPKRSL